MRRILFAGLLLTGACLDGTAPSAIAGLQVNTTSTANGVFVGDSVQINAVPLDISGNPLPLSVSYSSSNTAVGTVTTNGLVTILSVGTTTITVSAGHQNASVPITVDPNIAVSVAVAPLNPTVSVGSSVQLTATILTTLGHPARKTPLWSTSDATKVSVDQSGKATGIAATPGVAICATVSNAPASPPSFAGCTNVIASPLAR